VVSLVEVVTVAEVDFVFETSVGLVAVGIDLKTGNDSVFAEFCPFLLGPVEIHHILQQVLPSHAQVVALL